jgi:lysophospholipid acyltransferase (LPLAT)-like uncharacterized protein
MPPHEDSQSRLIRAAAWLASWIVRALVGTLRYHYRALGPSMRPRDLDHSGPYIFAFWHEKLLLLAYHYGRPNIHVLISQSADGELITQLMQSLGFSAVRGSSTRGGVQAVRHCLRLAANGHLAFTPDGPRGPRRRVQDGLLYLASRTGVPVVPVGIGYCRPWRARSWDRFAVPCPWSRACCITGMPIAIPADMDRQQMPAYRQQVEAAHQQIDALAEQWATTGRWPDEAQQRAA